MNTTKNIYLTSLLLILFMNTSGIAKEFTLTFEDFVGNWKGTYMDDSNEVSISPPEPIELNLYESGSYDEPNSLHFSSQFYSERNWAYDADLDQIQFQWQYSAFYNGIGSASHTLTFTLVDYTENTATFHWTHYNDLLYPGTGNLVITKTATPNTSESEEEVVEEEVIGEEALSVNNLSLKNTLNILDNESQILVSFANQTERVTVKLIDLKGKVYWTQSSNQNITIPKNESMKGLMLLSVSTPSYNHKHKLMLK